MRYDFSKGTIETPKRVFQQYGGFSAEETHGKGARIDLQFRLATNGVIVNTIVNGEPLITTSAGLFNQ